MATCMEKNKSTNPEKGGGARNCFSKQFKSNFDDINWKKNKTCKKCHKGKPERKGCDYCEQCNDDLAGELIEQTPIVTGGIRR